MSNSTAFEFTRAHRQGKRGEYILMHGVPTFVTKDTASVYPILRPVEALKKGEVAVKVETLKRVIEDISPVVDYSTKDIYAAREVLLSLIPKPTLREEIVSALGVPALNGQVAAVLKILRRRGIDLGARA